MKVLEINNVHKIYNSSEVKVHAVNGVTLEFEKGEFAAIVGPSGSGKTTLLNMIGGLDKPSDGKILVDHTNLAELKSTQLIDFRMRNIGFVFQSYNLIPVLTAKENVEFEAGLQIGTSWPMHSRWHSFLDQCKRCDGEAKNCGRCVALVAAVFDLGGCQSSHGQGKCGI